MWQHVKLSVQIHPWDTLACCWDDKQPTNQQTPPTFLYLIQPNIPTVPTDVFSSPNKPFLPVPTSPFQPVPTSPFQPVPTSPFQPVPTSLFQPVPTSPFQPVPTSPFQPVPTSPSCLFQIIFSAYPSCSFLPISVALFYLSQLPFSAYPNWPFLPITVAPFCLSQLTFSAYPNCPFLPIPTDLFLSRDRLWSDNAPQHRWYGEEGQQSPALCCSLSPRRNDAAKSHAEPKQTYAQHFLDGWCLLLEVFIDMLVQAFHHSCKKIKKLKKIKWKQIKVKPLAAYIKEMFTHFMTDFQMEVWFKVHLKHLLFKTHILSLSHCSNKLLAATCSSQMCWWQKHQSTGRLYVQPV